MKDDLFKFGRRVRRAHRNVEFDYLYWSWCARRTLQLLTLIKKMIYRGGAEVFVY